MSLYRVTIGIGLGYTFSGPEAELIALDGNNSVIGIFDDAAAPGLCQRIADMLNAAPKSTRRGRRSPCACRLA